MILGFESLVYKIKSVRERFLGYLSNELIAVTSHSNNGVNALELLAALMNLPASKLSSVGDMLWDYNSEPHAIPRDVQGAKSRIDFGVYESLSSTILFELKMAMLCMLEIPGAIRYTRIPKSYKPHTVLDVFKSVIPFIDQMCTRKRAEHGDHFFEKSHFSLADFTERDYQVCAENFDRAFREPTESPRVS